MKLRIDLPEHLTEEDVATATANSHRFKPDPLFSKTGVGSAEAFAACGFVFKAKHWYGQEFIAISQKKSG